MNWKSISKRFLVMLLVLSMVTGLVPVSAFAVGSDAGEVVDAAIIFSDLHTSENDYKESTVKGIFGALKKTNLPFSSVTSAGDAFSVNEKKTEYTGDPNRITGYIRTAMGNDDLPVNYVWSDHDRCATGIENVSGLVYGAGADGLYGTGDDGNYYVYALSMADMSTYNRYKADFYSDDEVTEHIEAFVDAAKKLDQTKPLFVVSHQPLLDRRGDNGHAYEWAVAINEVAEKMDVAYFFGHNHKYDVAGDYYYAKGDTMPVATTEVLSGSGYTTDLKAKDVVLNFPHICAGYMAPASTNSTSNTTRQGTAMAITIYENSIQYTTYDKNGAYTGSYAVDETVKRDHAGTTETPVEPDEPETPEAVEDTNGTGITVAAPGVTAVSVEVKEPEYDAAVYAAYASYDITPEGYKQGTEATVSVPAPENFDVNKPVLVLDQDKGEVIATTNIEEGKITFTTNHFSVYDVGQIAEGDTISGESVTIEGGTSYEEKTVYVPVTSLTDKNAYLIVNTGKSQALINSNGTDSSVSVTVQNDRVTVNGSTYSEYIEDPVSTAVWTAAANGSGFNLTNGGQYLVPRSSSDMVSASVGSAWSYDATDKRLSGTVTSGGGWGGNSSTTTYYVNYKDSEWENTTTPSSVLLYQEMTAQIGTSGTVTYTMRAGNLSVVLAESGTTSGELDYALLADGEEAPLSSGGSYGFSVESDSDNIVSSISEDGVVTFNGTAGTAKVRVSYTWTQDGKTYTVYKSILVEASNPYYTIELCKPKTDADGNPVTGADGNIEYVPITAPVAKKGVATGQTMSVWAVVKVHNAENPEGEDLGDLDDDALYWTVSDESIATIDTATGVIEFTGEEFGTFQVTVAYQTPYGDTVIDTITVSATKEKFIVPGDGTNDFPTYPNEGSIRFDKTAQAVGNFSKTGTALVELSMTGVPYTTDNRMDVVLMLDRSSSMVNTGIGRIPSTIAATKAFIKNIVMNEDGSFNNNRILVLDFLGGNLDSSQHGGPQHQFESNQYTQSEDSGYEVISSQAELDALFARIDSDFVGQTTLYGTEYAQGLEACYNALKNSKADGNQQFCVFMSDGIPNYMMGETTHFKKTSDIVARFTGNSGNNNPNMSRGSNYEYEYYSTLMKNDGVTVFTVGLGLHNTNSAWSGASAAACEQVANMLLNDIAGPAGETDAQRDTGSATSKLGTYFFSVADANAAADMEDVFSSIAHKIREAAKNVVVEDKIKDNYTVNFAPPAGINTAELGMEEYYIQAVEYKLDSNKERTGTPTVLENFTFDFNGALKSHSVDGVVTCEGQACTHIKFGAGQVRSIDGKYFDYSIAPYVDAEGNPIKNEHGTIVTEEYIRWNAEKLTTTELALQYFVYLDNSAGFIPEDQVDPGTYDTNEYATLTYDNYQGNRVQQEFPIPQLTWNGAQVSYVFYLVNEAGQPVNRAGRVVPFAEAVYVTDVHTQAVTWNDLEQTTSLDADFLAHEWVPDVYELYDEDASYDIHVYEDELEANLNNHFAIGGDVADEESTGKNRTNANTTYVFNTKADATKYNAYGTYVKDDVTVYLCKDYAVKVSGDKYSYTGTDTQWTPGEGEAVGAIQDEHGHVYYMDEEGKYYTIVEKKDGIPVRTGFDFANTTVAFAVVWKPELVPDVVVVDYGLDVVIDVTANDSMAAGVVGVRAEAPANVTMNSGNYTSAKAHNVQLYTGTDKKLNIGTAALESLSSVRFSLNKDNGMEFNEPAKFYYETDVNYYDKDNELVTTSMYSSVTVIPATTIYYEDSFVDFAVYNSTDSEYIDTWETVGQQKKVTQAQDRPGESRISAALDADNNYGYDAAYDSCSTFSLGSARKVTVNESQFAEAIFSFYGTGFDVISLTSNTTGTITVDLYDPSKFWGPDGNATYNGYLSTYMVDTYYGYTRDDDGNWVVNTNDAENSLYQVPVMRVEDLTYGHYTVVITAAYSTAFDHEQAKDGGSYDFYLDAIRIYDPANDGADNQDIENAYKADGEGWPSYMELRNQLIKADSFGNLDADAEAEGMVFIDGMDSVNSGSIGKYVSYGPNNEVYLASGQSVAFLVEAPANLDKMQIGIKSADGNTVNYSIKNVARTDIPNKVNVGGVYNEKSFTVSTATDMYYDLTGWKSDIIVITNTGSEGILSITNIKSTFTSNPADTNGQNGGRKGGVGIYMTPKAAELTLKAMKPAPVNPFADVKKDEFYYNAVLWAVENDITNGVDAAHFGPTLECNRAQVVTFLWRAAGSPEAETQRNPFVDVKETDFFYKAVLWAVENGITNGLSATTFGPDSLCNRAQVVTFLWRAKGEPVAMATGNPFSDVKADTWYGPAVLWAAENGITNGMGSGSFGINTICNRAQVVTFLHRAASLPELSES